MTKARDTRWRMCSICQRPTRAADGICDRHQLVHGAGLLAKTKPTKAQRDRTRQAQLEGLIAQGFDLSLAGDRHISVRCSQCEALVINGTACHETGCPHITHECHGCNARVARGIRYCDSCSGWDGFNEEGL